MDKVVTVVFKPCLIGCSSFGIVIQPANEVIVLVVVSGASRADAGICQDMIVCQKLVTKPTYSSTPLHKLSNGMNKLIVITRDFPSTESVAQFPTVYTSL
jgi:hypothetical protein